MLACFQLQSANAAGLTAPNTFSFQFANGAATATGSVTIATPITGSLTSGTINARTPSALSVVVAGAVAGNGTFVMGDFSRIRFVANNANFTTNLAGQAGLGDFNLFSPGVPAPNGTQPYELTSNNGVGTHMLLSYLFCNTCSAVQQPSAQQVSASYLASTQTVNGALDSVQARLEGVREGGESDDLNTSAADDLQQGKMQLATNGDTAGLFDASNAKKHGFWLKAFGAHGNQDQTSGFSGYTNNTYGTAFGADTLLENNWLLGAAFTYAHTGVDLHDVHSGDDTNIKTYQLTGYTSHNFGKWYVDGMLAYAKQDYSSSRNAGLAIAKGDFSGAIRRAH